MDNQSIDLLCEEIRKDAEKQGQGILDEAGKRQETKIDIARRDAEKIREKLLAEARVKAEAVKEKALSTVNLETKRIKSLAREEIINEVLQQVKLKQESFRKKEEYITWLENLIIEGALSLRQKELIVVISGRDFPLPDTTGSRPFHRNQVKERRESSPKEGNGSRRLQPAAQKLSSCGLTAGSILDGSFVSGVEKKLSDRHLKDVRIDLVPDDNLQDTGAVIKSRDGRIIFDNTFSARLQRMRTDLRVMIFKEIFKEYA